MPLGEEGQVGERIDLLFDLDLYIIIARTCVGNRCCIICITCITCVRIAGAAWRLQAYARQFGQMEGRTEVYPVVSLFKELEKSRSAFSRLNFTDREHRAMKPSRPASPQSLAMANAKRTYSQYPGAISTPAERTASTKRDKLSDM